jgi:uncharacterized protein DUF6868
VSGLGLCGHGAAPCGGFWFRPTTEQFDAINFAGIMTYKVGILLFNLVPYLALVIVG